MKKFILLLIFVLSLNAISLKQYLLQYCSKYNLTLLYNVSINPQVYPVSNFNFLNLSQYFNISISINSHFLIVTKPIPHIYVFSLLNSSPLQIKHIKSFLHSNHFSFTYSYNTFRVLSTFYYYYNILQPFFRSYSVKVVLPSF